MFSSRKSCKPLAVTQVSNNKMLSSPVRSFFCWRGRQFWSTSDKCCKKKKKRVVIGSLELKRRDKCGLKCRTNPQTLGFPWLRHFGHHTSCLLQKAAVCWAITRALQRDGRLFQSRPMHKEVFLWTLLRVMAFKTCRECGPFSWSCIPFPDGELKLLASDIDFSDCWDHDQTWFQLQMTHKWVTHWQG